MIPRLTARMATGSVRPSFGCIAASAPVCAFPAVGPAAAACRRTFMQKRPRNSAQFDTLNVEQLVRQRQSYDRVRLIFLASGALAGFIAMGYTAWQIKTVMEQQHAKKLDAGPGTLASDLGRPVIVHDKDGREMVPTGNSTVPAFPRTITAGVGPGPGPAETEYTLVGMGLRTVSFLSIQVYLVGYYVATADIAALQSRLIKRFNPIATTLVPGEKDELRTALLDPEQGEAIWTELLADGVPARSLFRIVPVRDTDFPHLRDGFVRAIQARVPKETTKTATTPLQPEFGEAVRQFRQLFNRGKVPKQKELLLLRDGAGALSIVFDDGRSAGPQYLGSVTDERLSRALWLNYLAGYKVASEPARQSIVDGILEFVGRPVGTVATQVK